MTTHNTKAQRERLFDRLRTKPCTTVEARHELDIFSPAPRVYELRHKEGHNIQTHWSYEINPGGKEHRVAKYVLLNGNYKDVTNEDK